MAGYIGDNYVWHELQTDGTDKYYVLSGSNRCPTTAPWCGYNYANTTPQALLFSSRDLIVWQFESVFWSGPSQPGNRVDTPDTFPLVDGSQAFLWLTGGRTVWMRGTFDRNTGVFTETDKGVVDPGSLYCQQSLDDQHGRRTQFGWVQAAGSGWSGAQSLPRVAALSARAQKLVFDVHPNAWTLHGARADIPPTNVTVGQSLDLTQTFATLGDKTGLHLHVRLSLTVPYTGAVATLHLLGGASKGGTSVSVTSTGSARACSDPASIVNNSDTAGSSVGQSPYVLNATGLTGAQQCQALCCRVQGCFMFTFTDPQPGGSVNECWLKGADGYLKPNTTWPNGHGWSGVMSTVAPTPPLPPTPPPPACTATTIYNNSDSTGNYVGKSPYPMNTSTGQSGAAECRSLCCATAGCAAWTFTDPQPGSTSHLCWLKDGSATVFPSSCGDGHCWSGGTVPPTPSRPLSPVRHALSVGVNSLAPILVTDADEGLALDSAAAIVDVFVDGMVAEVFANDGEASVTVLQSTATLTNASLEVSGPAGAQPIIAAVTAWAMTPSVN